MTVATALIAGNDPLPELAAEAVGQALARAGLSHASGVLLFLTADFSRGAQAAVHAASRAGNCLQVAGGIVAGVATEDGWVLDRPAAAAMVLGGRYTLAAGGDNLVGIAADTVLPAEWRDAADRYGLLFQEPLIATPHPAWQQGRLTANHHACIGIAGARRHAVVATGLRRLGPARRVDAAQAHQLQRLDAMPPVDVLRRELPADYRLDPRTLSLHGLYALVDADAGRLPRILPLVAAGRDGALTLGDRIAPGDRLGFAIRQPIDAERDLQARLGELAASCRRPAFGLFLSCIGRGPYFYAGDDRDWQLFRQRFPDLPFLGAYGNGQIAPQATPQVLQNCVVLNLFEAPDTIGPEIP